MNRDGLSCDELRDHYDLYAWGVAEEPERSEVRAHLDRRCEVCMARMKRALETAALLGASAPPAEPSRNLRRRILASVGFEERRSNWVLAWTAAAALGAMLFVVAFVLQQERRYAAEALAARSALAVLYAPGTIETSFGAAERQPPRGTVFVNPARGVLLIASNLTPTPRDKIYEMWLIPKGARPVPAGLFQSGSDGEALHVRPGAVDVVSVAAIAVTIEDRAGADQPTSTPLIMAQLPSSVVPGATLR
jgi:anti-sigma-K factor RskA